MTALIKYARVHSWRWSHRGRTVVPYFCGQLSSVSMCPFVHGGVSPSHNNLAIHSWYVWLLPCPLYGGNDLLTPSSDWTRNFHDLYLPSNMIGVGCSGILLFFFFLLSWVKIMLVNLNLTWQYWLISFHCCAQYFISLLHFTSSSENEWWWWEWVVMVRMSGDGENEWWWWWWEWVVIGDVTKIYVVYNTYFIVL